MTKPAESFEDLIARARIGDNRALMQLAQQYETEVRMVARARLGPALRPYVDSIDLVQSVHRSLIRGLQDNRFNLNEPKQLVALAVTMVRRKAAHAWRKMRRQDRQDNTSDSLPDMLVNLSSPHIGPTEAAEFRDAVARLCQGLDALDRDILLRNLQGYRTAEIARELGQDADVLRVRLSRLRAKLRATGVADDWV